jgi:hypothetical protein
MAKRTQLMADYEWFGGAEMAPALAADAPAGTPVVSVRGTAGVTAAAPVWLGQHGWWVAVQWEGAPVPWRAPLCELQTRG